jgi:hypothetical protein
MFNKNMIQVVKTAMELELKNICTYKGYAGADLLKLSFKRNSELSRMREWLKNNKFDHVVKLNDCVEIICIFEQTEDEEIYELKD